MILEVIAFLSTTSNFIAQSCNNNFTIDQDLYEVEFLKISIWFDSYFLNFWPFEPYLEMKRMGFFFCRNLELRLMIGLLKKYLRLIYDNKLFYLQQKQNANYSMLKNHLFIWIEIRQ